MDGGDSRGAGTGGGGIRGDAEDGADLALADLTAQREWFVAYAYGSQGHSVVHRLAHKHRVPSRLVDDVRQEWVESVLKTLANHAERSGEDPLEGMRSARQARAYVARALEHRIIDLFRGRAARDELVRVTGDDRDPDAVLDALSADRLGVVDVVADDAVATLDDTVLAVRRRLNDRYFAGALRCPKVSRAVFFAVALDLVAQGQWDGEPPPTPWSDELSGGTTTADRSVYEALARVKPGGVEVVDGRVGAADRQYKKRCQTCLQTVLAEVWSGPELDATPTAGPEDVT